MTIANEDQYIAAQRQRISFVKQSSGVTTIAAAWFSIFDQNGDPAAGTLAGANTANGVLPDDTVAGFPSINGFGGSATGYLGEIDFTATASGRLALYDCLFKAGAYTFSSAVSLTAQPSYLARTPDGAGNGCEIWFECVTAFTGNLTLAVTYTNQGGTAAQTTGTFAFGAAPTIRRLIQLPLATGDSGVQKIESVTSTVATVGTFNILVLRPLWSGRVPFNSAQDIHGVEKIGLPILYATSALYLALASDSTAAGVPSLAIDVVNG